jgi:microcystin-dependent protein
MDPYLSEIRLFAFDFIPRGWLPCDGRPLPIQQHPALYALIGVTYGGDGVSTFRLPDLGGRSVVHPGPATASGQAGGSATHALTVAELPPHRHAARATSAAATTADPAGARWAATDEPHYAPAAQVVMSAQVSPAGGGHPHDNMPPYLALTYAIAVEGVYPSEDSGPTGEAFVAELRLLAGAITPGGWAECNGQTIPIAQNVALFALLGTTYGGDGTQVFGLPDLRDRTPVHAGETPSGRFRLPGQPGGQATVALTQQQMPQHLHELRTAPAGARGSTGNPSGASWAVAQQGRTRRALYGTGPATTTLPSATAATGGGLPHNNLSPYLGVRVLIALVGMFPPRP